MTMPRKRADSIVSCFESKTYCRWTTDGHQWSLYPCGCGDTMMLTCENIESEIGVEVTW